VAHRQLLLVLRERIAPEPVAPLVPELSVDRTGRDAVHAQRREVDGGRAERCRERAAGRDGERPAGQRPLRRGAGGERDGLRARRVRVLDEVQRACGACTRSAEERRRGSRRAPQKRVSKTWSLIFCSSSRFGQPIAVPPEPACACSQR
jgi:hypothetical protein